MVQEHLGHTSLAMTQRYSHLSRSFQRDEIRRLNGLCDLGEKSELTGHKTVTNPENEGREVQASIEAMA